MDRDNPNSRYGRSDSERGSSGGRRIRRGNYEENYSPHYSGQPGSSSTGNSSERSRNMGARRQDSRAREPHYDAPRLMAGMPGKCPDVL